MSAVPNTIVLLVSILCRELAMFSALGFVVFAVDEFIVDALWLGRSLRRRVMFCGRHTPATAETLTAAHSPGKFAIFVPAWDESLVISAMLSNTVQAYSGQSCDVFVGCYPNDPATADAVASLAYQSVHLITCENPGPTTKADCLNQLWLAMLKHEEQFGFHYKGVVLHDSEDVVSPRELPIFDVMLERFDLVQLPVIPLVDPTSRFVSGHYCDEFAEAHGKTLIVRELAGAAIPSAGVGCGIRRSILHELAQQRGGLPFDVSSLTEDYELGLAISGMGKRTVFVCLPTEAPPGIVGTSAHFPATIDDAVRQKARWMVGIALAGWDRLGWRGGVGERWMRWRDRRALLAAILLLSGYAALVLFVLLGFLSTFVGVPIVVTTPLLTLLLKLNGVALAWRIAVRCYLVGRIYGGVEALLSIIRMPIANMIAIMAARRAVSKYWTMSRSGKVIWDKTAHKFPDKLDSVL